MLKNLENFNEIISKKLKKQSGCRNLQCWSYNQNHCV